MSILHEGIKFILFGVTLLGSFFSITKYKEDKRNEKPTFRIIQNLWNKNPKYELVNDANSKLDQIPKPSYLMLIPSKVYLHFKNGETMSIMVLTPVSYDVVTEQIDNITSTGVISMTSLPKNFYGKKGERDMVKSGIIFADADMKVSIETYPFLVIISEVIYKFKKKTYSKILISTPLCNEELEEQDYINILDYIADNSRQEIKLPKNDTSIYEAVNEKVVHAFKNQKDSPDIIKFFGGKEGGYGFILKKISQIVSPVDIMKEHHYK